MYSKIITLLLRRFSKTHKALALLPELLPDFAEALQAESSQVESDFLRLSMDLQNTHSEAMALVECAFHAASLVNGDKNCGVNRIDRIVQSALTQLRSFRDSACLDVDCFARGTRLMGNLYDLSSEIDKMGLSLGMVGLNTGVESSRSAKAKDLFGMAASDVRELSQKITRISENLRQGTSRAMDLQRKAHLDFSESIARLTRVSVKAEESVQIAAEKIRNLSSLSRTAMNQAGESSREISSQISRLVEGIQFHDNMHQRITHMNEALKEVPLNGLLTYIKEGISGKKESDLRRAHEIVAIQAAQLNQVIQDVDQGHQKNIQAFEAITHQVRSLAQGLSVFDSEKDSPAEQTNPGRRINPIRRPSSDSSETLTAAKTFFLDLSGAIEDFKGLLAQSQNLHQSMEATFSLAASSATRLSDSVSEVRQTNFKIHLLALNAIVKANHMGQEGRVLEVMAQSMKDIATQSNEFVGQVDALLEEILITTRKSQPLKTEPSGDVQDENQMAMENAHGIIMTVYEKFSTDSNDILKRAESLVQTLETSGSGLEFLVDLKERLSLRLGELEAFERLLRPWAGSPENDPLSETDPLKLHYTMAQEHRVHERLMAPKGVLPPGEKPGSPESRDEGFVLFDSTLPLSGCVPEDPGNTDDLGDNVELF